MRETIKTWSIALMILFVGVLWGVNEAIPTKVEREILYKAEEPSNPIYHDFLEVKEAFCSIQEQCSWEYTDNNCYCRGFNVGVERFKF